MAQFQAFCNFDAYIPVETWTKVPFNNDDHNEQDAFSPSNNNFVAPVAGRYNFGAKVCYIPNPGNPTGPMDPVTDAMYIQFYLNNNPVPRSLFRLRDGWGIYNRAVLTNIFADLSIGDIVDVRVWLGELDGYIEENTNCFWGFLVP